MPVGYCVDCGTLLRAVTAQRCRKCNAQHIVAQRRSLAGDANPNWKGGTKVGPHHCKQCGAKISWLTARRSQLCRRCAKNPREHVCQDCGKHLSPGADKRCAECYQETRRRPERTCVDCGRSDIEPGATRCIGCHLQRVRKPRPSCKHCGKQLTDSGSKTCSACRGIDRRVQKRCMACGVPVSKGIRCRSCAAIGRVIPPRPMAGPVRGRRVTSGYIRLYDPGHPRADRKGYVLEHILVAERMLGRRIGLDEQVHHINGKKDDNAPENLVVLSAAEHQRLHRAISIFGLMAKLPPEMQDKLLEVIGLARLTAQVNSQATRNGGQLALFGG